MVVVVCILKTIYNKEEEEESIVFLISFITLSLFISSYSVF